MFKLILPISRALLHEPGVRRWIMFYLLLSALFLLFAGSTFLEAWLRGHIGVFLVYWGFCGAATLLAVLLAVFDMLAVRSSLRREKRRLVREILIRPPADDEGSSSRQ